MDFLNEGELWRGVIGQLLIPKREWNAEKNGVSKQWMNPSRIV